MEIIDEMRRFQISADPAAPKDTTASRAALESDVERFLKAGGEIKKIPTAKSGWEGKVYDMGFKLNL